MKIVIKSLFSSVKKLKVPDAWPIFIKSNPILFFSEISLNLKMSLKL